MLETSELSVPASLWVRAQGMRADQAGQESWSERPSPHNPPCPRVEVKGHGATCVLHLRDKL